jgi:hypothetical protein
MSLGGSFLAFSGRGAGPTLDLGWSQGSCRACEYRAARANFRFDGGSVAKCLFANIPRYLEQKDRAHTGAKPTAICWGSSRCASVNRSLSCPTPVSSPNRTEPSLEPAKDPVRAENTIGGELRVNHSEPQFRPGRSMSVFAMMPCLSRPAVTFRFW